MIGFDAKTPRTILKGISDVLCTGIHHNCKLELYTKFNMVF
jgi:hypothetical protein